MLQGTGNDSSNSKQAFRVTSGATSRLDASNWSTLLRMPAMRASLTSPKARTSLKRNSTRRCCNRCKLPYDESRTEPMDNAWLTEDRSIRNASTPCRGRHIAQGTRSCSKLRLDRSRRYSARVLTAAAMVRRTGVDRARGYGVNARSESCPVGDYQVLWSARAV